LNILQPSSNLQGCKRIFSFLPNPPTFHPVNANKKQKTKAKQRGNKENVKGTFLALPIAIELEVVLLWHHMPTNVKFNSNQLVFC